MLDMVVCVVDLLYNNVPKVITCHKALNTQHANLPPPHTCIATKNTAVREVTLHTSINNTDRLCESYYVGCHVNCNNGDDGSSTKRLSGNACDSQTS